MTPDTTPDPMTHEEALAVIDREASRAGGVYFQYGRDMLALRAYIEAERTRADALAAEYAELEMSMLILRGSHDAALRQRAELEAVVQRCEALADEYAAAGHRLPAELIREALRGQRSDTGRTEG